jgi:hypothetical protein
MTASHLSGKDAAAVAQDTAPTFALALKTGLRDEDASEFRVGPTVWITIFQTNTLSHPVDTSGAYSGGINEGLLHQVSGRMIFAHSWSRCVRGRPHHSRPGALTTPTLSYTALLQGLMHR